MTAERICKKDADTVRCSHLFLFVVSVFFQYGEFQISDVTDFDKRFKLYPYKDVCDKDGYFPIERNGEVYWVQGAELAQYGYKVENKKIVRI